MTATMTRPRKAGRPDGARGDDGGKDDAKKKKSQVNVYLNEQEFAALERFRASMGTHVKMATAGREAILRTLIQEGLLEKAEPEE